MAAAEHRLDGAVAYRALVRYDAYGEMSGHQSTSIALLDARRDGVVLSSIIHREQARVYAKRVEDGVGELELSPEEQEAVDLALADAPPTARDDRRPRTPEEALTRVAYLGPEGTIPDEALLNAAPARPTSRSRWRRSTTASSRCRKARRSAPFVPIENSLEGSVNATLDALAVETADVAIVGEHVHPIHTCLIARAPLELGAIERVVSHPQAIGQCAHFLRTRLPQARVLAASSTAEAVRRVAEEEDGSAAALGSRTAAELYRCEVLCADVDDAAGNETRFVWLARKDAAVATTTPRGPWKTSIVFWGVGAEAPGWLVRCLSELASRGINMTRIESRPRKQGLGRYMFFVDLEGRDTDEPVAEALDGLRAHVEHLRVLGSFPAAV